MLHSFLLLKITCTVLGLSLGKSCPEGGSTLNSSIASLISGLDESNVNLRRFEFLLVI